MALVMLLMVDWVDHFTVCPLNMVDTMDPRNLRPDDVFMSVFAAPADEAQLEAMRYWLYLLNGPPQMPFRYGNGTHSRTVSKTVQKSRF